MQNILSRPATELLEDFIFSIDVEIERLSYFEALFRAIKLDQANGGHSVKVLARLGEYLAQDFTHYSQLDSGQLQAELQGANDEK